MVSQGIIDFYFFFNYRKSGNIYTLPLENFMLLGKLCVKTHNFVKGHMSIPPCAFNVACLVYKNVGSGMRTCSTTICP